MSADEKTVRVYTEQAETYADLPLAEAQTRALEAFLGYLPAGSRVLDLGAGPGLQAETVLKAGHDVEAWDATPAFVAAAKARGVPARCALFADLDAEETYDGIIASFSLLHAPRAEFPGHLARIARALRAGGILYLGLKLGTGEERDALGRFYVYYSEAELRRHLGDAGFRLAEVSLGTGKGLDGKAHPFILILAHG